MKDKINVSFEPVTPNDDTIKIDIIPKWINIEKDGYPKKNCNCIVFNNIGYMYNVHAIYHTQGNTFVLFDPNYRYCLTLSVTHYIIIPEFPHA